MGLFGKKKRTSRRATRKAEAKALKHKAKLEAKLGAKNDRKRIKTAARAEHKSTKAAAKSQRADIKSLRETEKNDLAIAKAQQATAEAGKLSLKKINRYLGIARVLVPVLAPLAYRGATALRGQIDRYRAEQMGVQVEELGQFTGHGARLSARISGAERSLAEITAAHPNDAETKQFAAAITTRLTDLSTAVDTAEHMPTARRRSAHAAIAGELDGIEADLLARLGVR